MSRAGSAERRRTRSRSPRERVGRDRRNGNANRMIYMSNLPYEMRWMDLKSLIREKGGEVNFVEILEDKTGRSKGCAIAEFATFEGAKKCLAGLNRAEVNGRQVVAKDIRDPEAFFRKVKEETGLDFLDRRGRSGRVGGRRDGLNGGGGGAPMQDEGELYGLSPAFLRQLNITPPLCDRIFAANLAYNITSGQIWEIFSMAGKVNFVDVQVDKEGKNRGNAVVEYSHPLEAVQAISMLNGQKLLDRAIVVKMDRYVKKAPLAKGELPRGLSGVGMGLGADGAPLVDIAHVVSSFRGDFGSTIPQQSLLGSNFTSPYSKQQAEPLAALGGAGYGGGGVTRSSELPFAAGSRGMQYDSLMRSGLSEPMQPLAFEDTSSPYSGPFAGGRGESARAEHSLGMFVGGARDGPSMYSARSDIASGGSMFSGRERSALDSFNGGSLSKDLLDYAVGYGGGSGDRERVSAGVTAFADGGSRDRGGAKSSMYTSRVIVIKNLPLDYTWQIVRDRATGFGEVETCDMIQPGVARVRFSQLSEAERARGALAGTSVEGRPISVDFVLP